VFLDKLQLLAVVFFFQKKKKIVESGHGFEIILFMQKKLKDSHMFPLALSLFYFLGKNKVFRRLENPNFLLSLERH
jgi:hypothetical protein